MESKLLSRKEFLTNSAKYAAGITAGMGALGLMTRNNAGASEKTTELPWPYVELDVEEARKLGHQGYWTGKGCSYGAFHAIIQLLKDEVGEPYTSLPTEFLEWGKSGGWGWGTICGALTGALTAMNICKSPAKASVLGSELIGWYTQTDFPTDTSNQYGVEAKFYDTRFTDSIVQTKANSPLCHISVSIWSEIAKVKTSTTERSERCGRLTGDVAAYAVQIMNDELRESFSPLYHAPESVGFCMGCHGTPIFDNVKAKMECVQCHGDHTGTLSADDNIGFKPTYKLNQNYPNPFNPSTTIQFSVPAAAAVYLAVYDVHGRLVKNLVDLEHYHQGIHNVSWDGTNNYGQRVSSGTYFYRLQAGDFVESKRMTFIK